MVYTGIAQLEGNSIGGDHAPCIVNQEQLVLEIGHKQNQRDIGRGHVKLSCMRVDHLEPALSGPACLCVNQRGKRIRYGGALNRFFAPAGDVGRNV